MKKLRSLRIESDYLVGLWCGMRAREDLCNGMRKRANSLNGVLFEVIRGVLKQYQAGNE